MSVVIIIAQATIFISDTTGWWWFFLLGVVFRSTIYRNPSSLDTGIESTFIQAVISLPLFYTFYCCYWSLSRLKFAAFYGLYPRHNTDGASLVFCAGMLVRLAFPLVYNYMFVLRLPDDVIPSFVQMQGQMNVVPLFGETFVQYFPFTILIVALLTVTKTYTKVLKFLNLNSLQFETEKDMASIATSIQEGKKLIEKERLKLNTQQQQQRRNSANQQPPTTTTAKPLGHSYYNNNSFGGIDSKYNR